MKFGRKKRIFVFYFSIKTTKKAFCILFKKLFVSVDNGKFFLPIYVLLFVQSLILLPILLGMVLVCFKKKEKKDALVSNTFIYSCLQDYLLPFELLFRDICDENQRNESILHLKSKIKDVGLSSFRLYNKKDHRFENLSEEEYQAFLSLSKNNAIIIQRAAKGNTVVLLEKSSYIKKNGRTSCRHQ